MTNALTNPKAGPWSRRRLLRLMLGLGIVGGATGYVGLSGVQYQKRRVRRWIVAFDGNVPNEDGAAMLQTALDDAKLRLDQPIRVVGHTGTVGAAAAKRAQSETRAEAVRDALVDGGIDHNRIAVTALSDQAPLEQQPGESRRAYERRLQRVEILVGSVGG
ncbi:MAG: OmpA family protein [Alphaproteobacteria bacterium]|nr:OmpA family protein [Alphaproteobacteria bacterium SS10]